jgi:hypothetical protein
VIISNENFWRFVLKVFIGGDIKWIWKLGLSGGVTATKQDESIPN